ncbi:hypothetical protein C8R43DRAFT_83195 [Mycena crocata]|nr:hypothetical protein C8R43DRAFT_83195 [Mycena crocata]
MILRNRLTRSIGAKCSARASSAPTIRMRGYGTFLVSFAALLLQVASQTSNVTACIPLYQWTVNSKQQTPCLVAAYLESTCQGRKSLAFRMSCSDRTISAVGVNAIPEQTHYEGPSALNATLCSCSTVTYSLISACGACQGRRFGNWTEWASNCPQVEVAQFLQAIPAEVVVPSWAYLNVTETDNNFNPIRANQTNSDSTTSSSSVSPTSSVTATFSSTASVTPPPSPEPASSKKSNAGAIAGGVVAGLVVLVGGGLAMLFWLRRRNRRLEESGHIPSSFSTSPPPNMQEHGSPRTAASPLSITPFPYEPFMKDPSETETYPGSPMTSAVHTTYDSAPSVSAPAVQILHRYTGSAEL